MFIYALHLVELTGRASNMLAAAAASSASKQSRGGSGSSLPPVTEHIFNAFENYERHTGQCAHHTILTIAPALNS
jgi:hypothetical protein